MNKYGRSPKPTHKLDTCTAFRLLFKNNRTPREDLMVALDVLSSMEDLVFRIEGVLENIDDDKLVDHMDKCDEAIDAFADYIEDHLELNKELD